MKAHLAQINRLNPKVNAISTSSWTRIQLLKQARAADAQLRQESAAAVGPLHGFPHAVKDLVPTAGIRTTSRVADLQRQHPDIRRAHRAADESRGRHHHRQDQYAGIRRRVADLQRGVRRHARSNDLSRTCGGSSGGGAVAVACGMTPLADGSDDGGSLRNPPSFCNVVGFRPSFGRVPSGRSRSRGRRCRWTGPSERSVRDVALLLSVLAGPDRRSPVAIDEPGSDIRRDAGPRLQGHADRVEPRLGRYAGGTGGEPCLRQRARTCSRDIGCRVEDGEPDFSDADETFQVLRAWSFAQERGEDLRRHRDLMKDTVIWNIEQGLALTGLDVSRAEAKRAALTERVRAFLERYEFLVLPVSQVAPFRGCRVGARDQRREDGHLHRLDGHVLRDLR